MCSKHSRVGIVDRETKEKCKGRFRSKIDMWETEIKHIY